MEYTDISERTIITGMANTASKSAGVQIIGIDPDKEKKVFTLNNKVMPGTGDYFEKDSKLNLALIGQELAKDLNIIRYSVDSSTIARLKRKRAAGKTHLQTGPDYRKKILK